MSYGPDWKTYKGTYKDINGNSQTLKVKFTDKKRFRKMSGMLNLDRNAMERLSLLAGTIMISSVVAIAGARVAYDAITENKKPNIEVNNEEHQDEIKINETISLEFPTTVDEENKNYINAIIQKNPNILKDVTYEYYEVKGGDNLSYIAQECGNTVSKICLLNNINSNDTLYQGQRLKIEVLKDKDEADKEMVALESYFGDYILKSQVSRDYKNYIFGTSDNTYTDENSVLGKFIKFYTNYHQGNKTTEEPEETKSKYISELKGLAREINFKLNEGKKILTVVPFEKYMIYLENGTTVYENLQDDNSHLHSVYGK